VTGAAHAAAPAARFSSTVPLRRAVRGVRAYRVRLRSEGRRIAGDILVVPSTADGLVQLLDQARAAVLDLDWRVHDVVIAPVATLPE
jgi:hypothetical protein